MTKTIFEFVSYRAYLLEKLSSRGGQHGIKSKAAVHCQIQSAYLSNVLKGKADLNLEQADRINSFFLHNKEESHFFLLLLQKERAGTTSLKKYFQVQLEELKNKRLILIQRLGEEKKLLSEEDKQKYYSSWIYAAIHVASTISELQNKKNLQTYLNIPLDKFLEALDFLNQAGLIVVIGDTIQSGNSSIRLGNNSHNIIKHHTHWRIQAIESLERETLEDLHYSAVFSLSKKDVTLIKNKLLDYIKETVEIVKESPEETLYNFNMDFYCLNKVIRSLEKAQT